MKEALVQTFSLKGYGVAPVEGLGPVEISHTIPGDRVLFEPTRVKRSPKKGRLLEVLSPSPDRVTPPCPHASLCGGCCWQQLSYEAQLKEKQRRVEEAFGPSVPIDPILPCSTSYRYRNKMEFSFSENRAGTKFLGLMIAQAEPYVFNVEECHLVSPWFSEALKATRAWWEQSGLLAYYPPGDRGALRYLTLRETRRGDRMAILNVSGNPDFALTRPQLDTFIASLKPICPSLFLRIHQTKKGRPTQFYELHLHGPDHMVETLHLTGGDLSFKISPASFFQPNTHQAERLYNIALELVGSTPLLYDLYCGTGTLAMAASRFAKEVIGIELSPEAVLDAEENAKRNHLSNVRFLQGDVGQVLKELRGQSGFRPPDTLLVDPPRAGLDEVALSHIKALSPSKIIYISCNPLTQAANIEQLLAAGYRLERVQPVDQFPHTYHIETVALLTKH